MRDGEASILQQCGHGACRVQLQVLIPRLPYFFHPQLERQLLFGQYQPDLAAHGREGEVIQVTHRRIIALPRSAANRAAAVTHGQRPRHVAC